MCVDGDSFEYTSSGLMNQWKRFITKARWAMLAWVAPEIVVSMAYTQQKATQNFCRGVNSIPEETSQNEAVWTPTKGKWEHIWKPTIGCAYAFGRNFRKQVWTISEGFNVVMGGFGMAMKNPKNSWMLREWIQEPIWKQSEYTMTAQGSVVSQYLGLLSNLNKTFVAEQSKADSW